MDSINYHRCPRIILFVKMMLLCVFLLMCLKLLSDAVKEVGLLSFRMYDPMPCTTWNNETGVCLDIHSCQMTISQPTTAAMNLTDICGSHKRSPKVCCPSGTRSTLKSQSTNNDKADDNVDWGKCGTSNKILRFVVGGDNATLGDWPWMVALYYKSSESSDLYFHCGGSLISVEWVITAAHCIRNVSGILEPSIARLGDLNLHELVDDRAYPLDVYIDKIIMHPNYSQSPIVNDIALLHLGESVHFTEFIRPICLLSGSEYRKDSYYRRKRPYITGWGKRAFNGTLSAVLQETSIPIVNSTECARIYAFQTSARIDDTVLCAGEGGKDSCQGDSGGPLMIPNPRLKTFYLAGIVSYGVRCGDHHFPGVYTRIAAFTDWITNVTEIQF